MSFVGNPEAPRTLYRRATALQELKRYEEALACCDEAIALKPDYGEAMNKRGVILAMLKRFDEALASFERALAITPENAEIMVNRGNVLGELERFEEAVASYDKAVSTKPGFSGALNGRALALASLKRFDDALASFDRSLAIAPDNAEVWTHRGNVLNGLERFEEALASYDKALAITPNSAKIFNDRGVSLAALERFDEALENYSKAISLSPASVQAHHNRGLALASLRRYDEALASFDRAVAIQPDFADAHFSQGLCRLVTGDFELGWPQYEWRWNRWKGKDRGGNSPNPPPRWLRDRDIRGQTLLLGAEQGLGDTIQFCRYASLVSAKGAKVILEVQRPLRSLLASLPGTIEVMSKGEALPAFDMQCPLLSLPLAFGTTLDTIPATVPYLTPSASCVEIWRGRVGSAKRPRIGLVWSGHPDHKKDRHRSVPANEFARLTEFEGSFFSLQKELRAPDREFLESIGSIRHFGEQLDDFSDTAALVSLMDVVISVDTSVAHLAGALGKPVWILLPYAPDWRWLLDREDSPWYPTARLFRQPGFDDWKSVVRRIAGELARLEPGV